jgi:NodT family efflux transporter outer membrane factor (OMF) lipoprotein
MSRRPALPATGLLGSGLLGAAVLAGCAVGPNYHRPSTPISAAFKEQPGWTLAAPADALDRGDWWTLFGDPVLDGLEQRVQVSNQNIAAAEAAYRQARALVRQQRASLFPTVTLNGGGTRTGGGGGGQVIIGGGSGPGTFTGGGGAHTSYRVDIGGSWEPDVWGRIRRTIENARANAQASEADLAAARLSAQGELAADYFGLRETDAAEELSRSTVASYQRSLKITQNRYNAGVAAHSDVLQTQTQLLSAQADLAGLEQQRATYEHAIAVLVGEAPANFSLAPAPWSPRIPEIPVSVPSVLLQRRPDIASAERRVAAANAQVGVNVAAYFPDITLTGSGDFSGSNLGQLFSASNFVWSLGAQLAETIFDAGARSARVSQARAAYDQAVAQYRQTALSAFQDVEDQLAATRLLAREYALRQQASAAADLAEQMVVNQYQAGTVSYVEVATAQASAYSARRSLVQAAANRETTAVSLIQALGGGWRGLAGVPAPPAGPGAQAAAAP